MALKGSMAPASVRPSTFPSLPVYKTNTVTATPVAAGVVACMLAAGQAGKSPKVADVRALLDSWAPVRAGLKFLKNAPELTLL